MGNNGARCRSGGGCLLPQRKLVSFGVVALLSTAPGRSCAMPDHQSEREDSVPKA